MALFPLELLRMWVHCIDISMKSCHISVQHILPTLSLNLDHIIKAAAAAPCAHLFSMKERWMTVHCWSRLQPIYKYEAEKHHGSMNTTNSFTSAVTHFSQKQSSILSLYTNLLDLQHSRQISTILFRILNWNVTSDGTRDLSLVNVPFTIRWFQTFCASVRWICLFAVPIQLGISLCHCSNHNWWLQTSVCKPRWI
jgi:hypothetical protein